MGYYATSGHVASAVKGIAARALSPIRPVPQPVRAEAWALKGAMMAAQSYMLAATAHGLATSPMEGFARPPAPFARRRRPPRRRLAPRAQDAERLRAYLDVPDRYSLPLVIPTGYAPADATGRAASTRLPPADVFFGDRFGGELDLPPAPGASEQEQ